MDSSIGTVIIPCMGKSERFKAAGFTEHKALLHIGDHRYSEVMIRRIINTIPLTWDIRLIVPYDLRNGFADACRSYGERVEIITVAGETEGQSSTILRGLLGINAAKQVAITNCDVEINPGIVHEVLNRDGSVVVVHEHSHGAPIYSYAQIDLEGWIVRVAEKERISNWAQTGFWKFHKAGRLHKAIAAQIHNDDRHTNGEFYLSGAMQHFNYALRPHYIGSNYWADYGTPEAVLAGGMQIG